MMKRSVVYCIALGFALGCGESEEMGGGGTRDAVIDQGGQVPDSHVPDAIIEHGGVDDFVTTDEFLVDPGFYEEISLLPEEVVSLPEEVTVDLPSDLPSPDEGVYGEHVLPKDVPVQDLGGAGTGSCTDITDCITENSCQTQQCYQMCLELGTPQAQQQFLGLLQCGNQRCGQYGQDKPMQGAYCVYSQCREFAEPCTKTGTATCMQVLQCAQGCGQNNEACVQACFEQASYDALLKILAIAACAEQNCPDMNQTCLMTKCMQQIMACTSG